MAGLIIIGDSFTDSDNDVANDPSNPEYDRYWGHSGYDEGPSYEEDKDDESI